MDWNAAIERNREALKRVLAMLVAMAGLAGVRPTLPRHLHRAVLRLLRPAEAAARRLVIVAARGIVVAVSSRRPRRPSHAARPAPSPSALRADTSPPEWGEDGSRACRPSSPPGTGGEVARVARRRGGKLDAQSPCHSSGGTAANNQSAKPLRPSFHLFDPLRRFQRRLPLRHGVPRISFPGFSEPFPIPLPPSTDDPVDATRLALRLAALAKVLDDLPREARRFARWRCRNAAQTEESRHVFLKRSRVRRVWPLRPGRPPGHRPANRGPRHAVHDVLDVAHGLAFWALESPDTS